MFSTPFTFLKQPSASGPSDPDAEAYLAAVVSAGGTTDSTIVSAVDNLFISLKAESLYSLIDAFYPVVGGVAASHALNGNLNSTYDLTFFNSFTHSSDGFVTTAANSYASTNYIPSNIHLDNAMTMGVYTNTVGITGQNDYYIMGTFAASDRFLSWDYFNTGGDNKLIGKYLDNNTTLELVIPTADWPGVIQLGSNGTTAYFSHYSGGVETSTSAARDGGAIPNYEIYLGNLNLVGSVYGKPQAARIAFAYLADELTPAQMTTLAGIIETYETALGR